MWMLTKCNTFVNEDIPGCLTTCNVSWDWCSQYLAHYMPDISAYTMPLLGCVRNGCPFEWTPLLDKCLESIKTLACKAPILKPIDYDNPDPILVITDGSKAGVGAVYGQGPNWKTCRPAGFISKKFSNAQQHYQTHEHEMIAMLEARSGRTSY